MTTHQPPLINHIPPPPHKRRLSDEVPSFLGNYIPTFTAQDQRRAVTQTGSDWDWYKAYLKSNLHSFQYRPRILQVKDFLDVRLLLGLLWLLVLWWGERATFNSRINACDWRRWENWPAGASPHRVALIADPQLVDPHTYPGRPWPLSKLTVAYTDLYLQKSFQRISTKLDPNSVFFLGDLFDGGREWSPPEAEHDRAVERRWWKYGQKQWFKEYDRFSRLFIDPWIRTSSITQTPSRKISLGLPGNHDLGFGNGIRLPIRNRFAAYFGEPNRIDFVGNHTFITMDTVSLSAKNQIEPGRTTETPPERGREIWEPAEHFLHRATGIKSRAVSRHLRTWAGEPASPLLEHTVVDLTGVNAKSTLQDEYNDTDVPSILLTHVPLYRQPGTPCGPLREHWPPSQPSSSSASHDLPEKDDRNAIAVQMGEQYQNVLTQSVTSSLIEMLPDITHVFSGDDHDYCDLVHRSYTSRTGGGIREITVKSISWAMGIRKPGFVMLSLWNPLSPDGKRITPSNSEGKETAKSKATLQTHLCLLPDQLSIFIHYAQLLLFTLTILLLRAVKIVVFPSRKGQVHSGNGSLLPLSRSKSKDEPPSPTKHTSVQQHSASSSTSDHTGQNGHLSVRSKQQRAHTPSGGYGYTPPTSTPMPQINIGGGGQKAWEDIPLSTMNSSRQGARAVWVEFRWSLLIVGVPVGTWYFWLLRYS